MIKNKEIILSHGNRRGREIALDIVEYAVNAVNGYASTKRMVHAKNSELTVENLRYDLARLENVYVIGAGKATFSIAQALDEILGERISRGIVIVKRGERRRLRHVRVIEAGHPVPDQKGLEGTKEIVEIAKSVKKDDLVFCIITGGASALMPWPAANVGFEDKKIVTEMLLRSGAKIDEINAVRNHISSIKGGKLAKYLARAAIINLMVIDEISGRPWGPTAPDPSTFMDAVNVLRKYRLWDKVPHSISKYLRKGLSDPSLETPKDNDFRNLKIRNVLLADNRMMCEAATKRSQELGFEPVVLSTVLEGESREAGIFLGSIAREVEERGTPIRPPCALIIGGETTCAIAEPSGKGGPSQELALGASLKIDGSKRIVLVSMDTDGTDGPTEIAGGIVDGLTSKRAKERNLDIFRNLMKHNSSRVLTDLEDAIVTGATGTNVMDLNVIVIGDNRLER